MNIESIQTKAVPDREITAALPAGPFAEVERLRDEIAAITEELGWVESSALPKAEAKKRASAAFAAHTDTFRLPVWHFAEPGSGANVLREMMVVHGASQIIRSAPGGDEMPLSVGAVSVNLTELLLGLFSDELLAKVHKQIDGLDYTAGPASKERPPMMAKLKVALRDLGMQEEALICAAEENGIFIPRRADADPVIVLGYIADGERHEPAADDHLTS